MACEDCGKAKVDKSVKPEIEPTEDDKYYVKYLQPEHWVYTFICSGKMVTGGNCIWLISEEMRELYTYDRCHQFKVLTKKAEDKPKKIKTFKRKKTEV